MWAGQRVVIGSGEFIGRARTRRHPGSLVVTGGGMVMMPVRSVDLLIEDEWDATLSPEKVAEVKQWAVDELLPMVVRADRHKVETRLREAELL